MRSKRILVLCASIFWMAHVRAAAQGLPAIEFSVQEDGLFTPLPGSGAVTFQAPGVGMSVSARLRIRNISVTDIAVGQVAIQGPRFGLAGLAALPAMLSPNQSLEFGITYTASSSARATAQLSVIYSESTSPSIFRSAVQALAGTAPEFRLAYVTPEANTFPLENGSTIDFPSTQTNSNSLVTLVIGNVGTSPGLINSANLTGSSAFRFQGLPLFPAALEAGREFRFNIRFVPTQSGTETGTLRLAASAGEAVVQLRGAATSSSFTYEVLLPDESRTVLPGSKIILPETPLGSTTTVAVRVINNGTGDGLITALSVVGNSFRATDAPILPVTLPPQNSIVFTLSFIPFEPGPATGRLRIGNDNFDLEATGAGARLTLSYTQGGATVSVPSTGSVIFPPTQVGGSSTVELLLQNKGNRPAAVANVSLAQTGNSFSLQGLASLPVTLQPEESLVFSLRFLPSALGQFSANIRVNGDTYAVNGSASQPPAVPRHTFTGPSGAVEQMQQPGVGLTLETPYSLPLTGTLTIGFESESFAVDPAVQFATGGRTVGFTIQPGSREAVFSNGSTSVRLQTGTVAGTITVTSQFRTADLDVTPAPAQVQRLNIAPVVPRIVNVQLGSLAATGVTFIVTGTSTSRTLQGVEINFTRSPSSSVSIGGTRLSLDVAALAETYYRSATSTPFGGAVQLSIPISLNSSSVGAPGLTEIFESAEITLINSLGRSTSVTVPLR